MRSIIRLKRQVCWVYTYYHYDYCFFLLPTKRFEVVSWFECSCSSHTMSTRGNHNVNRLSIPSRPELPGTSCSLRVKATCYSLMSLGSGTAAIPKLLQVPFVTWCSSLIFLAPALAAWKLSPKCPLLDRIWHYPCKDNPFVQDIQKPRLAMVAHRQIDLFDPFWGSSRASHSNNDGIWRDFSNFPPTRHQLMLLHRGNRQWLPPAEFPPWPQAPQAPFGATHRVEKVFHL